MTNHTLAKKQLILSAIPSRISSLRVAITTLSKLDIVLPKTYLKELWNFNHTYLLISKGISAQLKNHYFANDKRMKQLNLVFLKHYLIALKNYINGKKIAPTWQLCFDTCNNQSGFNLIFLALGANAHINHDLPKTLVEIKPSQQFKSDYQKVNQIIKNQLNHIIIDLQIYPNFRLINPLLKIVMLNRVMHWRSEAWKKYQMSL